MVKLLGLLILDLLLISIPWILQDNFNDLLVTIEYILIFLTLIAVITTISLSKTSDAYDDLMEGRNEKPKWWNIYDITTDVLFILSWINVGAIGLAILYIIHKAIIMIKIPEYYSGE